MKKFILTLLILVPFGLHAQQSGFDKLIKKYENREGITVINLEGNILEGISYFVSQLADREAVEYNYDTPDVDYDITGYDDDEPEIVAVAVTEECDGDCCEEDALVAETAGEHDIMEYVYGETGDYDYDDEYDFDYSSYYSPYSGLTDYLGLAKSYLEGMTYFKAIVYENPGKKFAKDFQRSVVAAKPYKCVVSMRSDSEDIRFYVIDDVAGGQCEMLALVKDGTQYYAVNILGNRDFKEIIDAVKGFL